LRNSLLNVLTLVNLKDVVQKSREINQDGLNLINFTIISLDIILRSVFDHYINGYVSSHEKLLLFCQDDDLVIPVI